MFHRELPQHCPQAMPFRINAEDARPSHPLDDSMATSAVISPKAEADFLQAYRDRGLKYATTGMVLGFLLALTVSLSLWLYDADAHKATVRIAVYVALSVFLLIWAMLVSYARSWAIRHYLLTVGVPVAIGTGSMSIMYFLRIEDHAAPWTHGPAAIILVLFITAAFTRLPVWMLTGIAALNCSAYIYCIWRLSEPLFPASLYLALTVPGVWALGRDIERRERTVFAQLVYVAAASTAKSRVLASVSHDLRQPLGALALYLDLFKDRNDQSAAAEWRRHIDRMGMCVQAMEGNLSRLLEIGRLQSDNHRVPVRNVDVESLLTRLQSVYALQASTSKITLSFPPVPLGCRWATSSDTRMFEVLSNILHNALKFTQQRHGAGGGDVSVRALAVNASIEIRISDNGPGIAEADHEKIFEEYVQVVNSERDHRKGYGLGLAVVRQIVDSLPGHDIHVASTLGSGACFSVTLPMGTESIETCDDAAAVHADTIPAVEMKGRLVLLIEDDVLMREALAQTLRNWGIEVDVGASIRSALKHVRTSDLLHDVVLSDWRLPGDCTGAQAIDLVRKITRVDIPAVVITGELVEDQVSLALPSNTTLLRKPLGNADLYRALREAFRRSDVVRRVLEAAS